MPDNETAPVTETRTAGVAKPNNLLSVYFKKTHFGMPFFFGGKPVPFEALAQNTGVIALPLSDDNLPLREALAKAAHSNRGGVVSITAEQYQDLKKKLPWTPSAPSRRNMLQVWNRNAPRVRPALPRPVANAAVGNNPAKTSSTPGTVGPGVAVGGGGVSAGPETPLNPAMRKLTKGPVMRKPKVGNFRPDAVIIPNP